MKYRNNRISQLVAEEDIQAAIVRLAERICLHYKGKTVVLVGVLTGAYVFMDRLGAAIEKWNRVQHNKLRRVRLIVDFLDAASYQPKEDGFSMQSGQLKIYKDIRIPICGRHVVLVDDVFDTGRAMKQIVALFLTRKPRSLRVVTMLRKRGCAKVRLSVPLWTAMTIPGEYVVGMGLDSNGWYRTLPYIGILQATQKTAR